MSLNFNENSGNIILGQSGGKEMDIGNRVRELRKERKMTAKFLANAVGVSPPFISALEHQSTNVSINTLEKICQTMDISLSEFFAVETSTISPSLLALLEQLTPEQQGILQQFLRSILLENPSQE